MIKQYNTMENKLYTRELNFNSAKIKFNFVDILVILCLIFYEAGSFGLPLNLYQFIIVGILAILLTKKLYSGQKISISIKLVAILGYMALITAFNQFDSKVITGFIFFVIEIFALYFWMSEDRNFVKTQKIIYGVAVFLSIYGVIQEIAFLLDWQVIYDLTLYGFPSSPDEIRNGFLSVSSFYSEPSHCVNFISWGLWIGLTQYKKKNYVSAPKNLIIVLCAFLTQSAIVYISCIVVLFAYLFIYKKGIREKVRYLCVVVFAGMAVMVIAGDMFVGVISRLTQFLDISTTTSNDLSALAIVSNFQIAIEKMKDGFLFGTGFDTHRIYYFSYIKKIYGSLIMYLNIEDAGTLFTRIFSEFGIVGLAIFILAILKQLFKSIKKNDMNKFSFLLIFLLIIMRNGQYENIYTVLTFLGAFIVSSNKGEEANEKYKS